jgi:hypothetical protein
MSVALETLSVNLSAFLGEQDGSGFNIINVHIIVCLLLDFKK